MVKETIYQGINYKQLNAIKKGVTGSKIIQVMGNGYKYALFDKRDFKLNINIKRKIKAKPKKRIKKIGYATKKVSKRVKVTYLKIKK